MPVLSHRALLAALRLTLAAGSAALVLALSVFAASPAAHEWLHAETGGCVGHTHSAPDQDAEEDPGCAVVLFASGVSLPVAPAALTPPTLARQGVSPVTAADALLVSPRYLRQPERGPPGLV